MRELDKRSVAIVDVDKWKPAKGVVRTARYSFEITHQLQNQLEEHIMVQQLRLHKRISTSSVIRKALKAYLAKENK